MNKYIFSLIFLGLAMVAVPSESQAAATNTIKIYASSGDGQAGIGDTENVGTWSAARAYTDTVSYTTQDTETTNGSRSDLVSSAYRLYRGSLPFDTGIIPDDAEIESAVLHLYGQGTTGSQGGAKACVTTHVRSNAENIVGSDYHINNFGSAELATSTALINYEYTEFELSTSGLDHIELATSTAFGVRTHFDCENTDPGTGTKAVNWYASEASGTSTDPYLEVTYTIDPVSVQIYAGSGDGQAGIGDTENVGTWSAARAYTGTVSYTTQDTQTTNASRSDKVSSAYRLYRGTLPFNTSIVPDDAEIESSTLYLYGQGTNGSQGGAKACINTHTRSDMSDVVGNDFHISNYGSAELATSTVLLSYQYTPFNLIDLGLDHINVLGSTAFGVRTHFDCENTDPGTGTKAVNWYASEASGTSTDPYLEVTYYDFFD